MAGCVNKPVARREAMSILTAKQMNAPHHAAAFNYCLINFETVAPFLASNVIK